MTLPRVAPVGWVMIAVMVIAACEAATPTPQPTAQATPTIIPEPVVIEGLPAGWAAFRSGAGDFELGLPPWLVRPGSPDVFPGEQVLFAEEPLAPGETAASTTRINLRVNGPGSQGDGPPPGMDLATFLRLINESPTAGVPVITRVSLPAGPAVRLERVDLPDTPHAQHLVAFLIETPAGLAYIQVHGYEFAWPERAADVELISRWFRVARAPAQK